MKKKRKRIRITKKKINRNKTKIEDSYLNSYRERFNQTPEWFRNKLKEEIPILVERNLIEIGKDYQKRRFCSSHDFFGNEHKLKDLPATSWMKENCGMDEYLYFISFCLE
ncbi:MAG: hypothetical protein DRH04_02060 [Deltaproteobacteria bacterium]|nr:MAG: hypothetical protein DRH04_02060 [Deltaproteobacteria bacterium]